MLLLLDSNKRIIKITRDACILERLRLMRSKICNDTEAISAAVLPSLVASKYGGGC